MANLDAVSDWMAEYGAEVSAQLAGENPHVAIATLEGTMTASPGDWVIRGVKGEFYPCKPDVFDATYEPETERAAALTSEQELSAQLVAMTDRATAAEARVRELEDATWRQEGALSTRQVLINRQKARIAALEAALREIATAGTYLDTQRDRGAPRDIARRALTETTEETKA